MALFTFIRHGFPYGLQDMLPTGPVHFLQYFGGGDSLVRKPSRPQITALGSFPTALFWKGLREKPHRARASSGGTGRVCEQERSPTLLTGPLVRASAF